MFWFKFGFGLTVATTIAVALAGLYTSIEIALNFYR
jgi:hypothetical protein